MCEKRFSTDKERLALARKMDINNLTDKIVEKRKKSIRIKNEGDDADCMSDLLSGEIE